MQQPTQLGSVAVDITALTGSTARAVAAPIVGGSIAAGIGVSAATATALVGGGIALVTYAIIAFLTRKGPKQREATTAMVNELEPLLQRNRDEYLNGPRTPESQAVAFRNFDNAFAWLRSSAACGNQAMGNPGKARLSDRDRGDQFDWYAAYRDPITAAPPIASPDNHRQRHTGSGWIDTSPYRQQLRQR